MAGPILSSVESMIFKIVRVHAGPYLCNDDLQEIVQEIRIGMWIDALPRFDAWRGVRLTTYLYKCINNSAINHLRRLNRHARSPEYAVRSPNSVLDRLPAPDAACDPAVEDTARRFFRQAADQLTAKQVAVLRFIGDNPGVPMNKIAAMLGYKQQRTLSMLVKRMRDVVSELPIEADVNRVKGEAKGDHGTDRDVRPAKARRNARRTVADSAAVLDGRRPRRVRPAADAADDRPQGGAQDHREPAEQPDLPDAPVQGDEGA